MPNYHLTPPDLKPQDISRFHRSYLKTGDCWLWQRVRSQGRYGVFKMFKGRGRPIRIDMAHRVQFFLKTNEWPEVVRHTCDNPPCVNPSHLLGGTQADNIQDCVDRGRTNAPRGTQCHKARLTEADVRYIRKNWKGNGGDKSHRELAEMFHVAKPTVVNINATGKTPRTWKHVV